MSKSCDSLFISPHLDDAVLSCALKILQERQAGRAVAVATVCTKGLGLPAPFDLYGGRRHEDDNALAVLGVANPIKLDFQDAPFRNIFYRSFERVIMRETAADQSHGNALAKRVNELLGDLAPETVYLPLAVGTHIDHRHTHRLWCTLPSATKIVFYEDRPYSLLPYNLQLRLIEIGAGIAAASPQEESITALETSMSAGREEGLRTFVQGLKIMTMYKNVLTSERQSTRYILSAAEKLKAPPADRTLKLQGETIRTARQEDLDKINAAVGAYTSQISMLFKDMDTFSRESASYNNKVDATALYCERYWTLVR